MLTNIYKLLKYRVCNTNSINKFIKKNKKNIKLGQICHRIGSLLPTENNDAKFLQVYFLGDENNEIDQRLGIISGLNREIITNLQSMLHKYNHLIRVFKYALEHMPTNDYKLVLKADKIPQNIHEKRCNLPNINEVAIIMVDDDADSRDIILHKRSDNIQRVTETHISYDALQYPLLFWQGEDGYHIKMKLIDKSVNL